MEGVGQAGTSPALPGGAQPEVIVAPRFGVQACSCQVDLRKEINADFEKVSEQLRAEAKARETALTNHTLTKHTAGMIDSTVRNLRAEWSREIENLKSCWESEMKDKSKKEVTEELCKRAI